MVPIVSNEHREERKKIILDAALEVFISKGYNATTIQDIIEHSGVSRGGVYTYFLNTEDIFLELLKKRDVEDIFNIDALFAECDTSWDALMKVFDSFRRTIEENSDGLIPAIYEYYFTTGYKSKKHLPFIESRLAHIVEILAEIINRGIERAELNPSSKAEDIARTIMSFCDGVYINCFHLGVEKIKLRRQFQLFEMYLKKELIGGSSMKIST